MKGNTGCCTLVENKRINLAIVKVAREFLLVRISTLYFGNSSVVVINKLGLSTGQLTNLIASLLQFVFDNINRGERKTGTCLLNLLFQFVISLNCLITQIRKLDVAAFTIILCVLLSIAKCTLQTLLQRCTQVWCVHFLTKRKVASLRFVGIVQRNHRLHALLQVVDGTFCSRLRFQGEKYLLNGIECLACERLILDTQGSRSLLDSHSRLNGSQLIITLIHVT